MVRTPSLDLACGPFHGALRRNRRETGRSNWGRDTDRWENEGLTAAPSLLFLPLLHEVLVEGFDARRAVCVSAAERK